MNYKKLNTAVGWGVFALALLVYLLTVAPTASFWDCGEFIAAANELEVTHPPGAPFFLLIGRIFAMLAFNNTANIAFMVNLVSVFASAFTAMFTFWITTYLAKKIVWQWQYDEKTKATCIMIAGIVAGMTCTFADSIWFNAVEAEVYALSSFFTAIVVWLMLKWEERAEEAHHLKWIILIAYLVGLSTGVHLLNLLTIPALALIYYFKKYDFSWKGLAITLGISVAILAFVQYGMLQYTIILAQKFELFFTGAMTREGVDKGGMGYTMGTGSLILGFLLITTSIILLIYSHLKQKHLLNTIVLCYVVLMMGFSSYLIIFIRSGANPPLDMNNPENVMTFLSYMRREQYGDRPLLYGARYNVPPIYDKEGYPVFEDEFMRYTILEGKNKYIEDEMAQDYAYPDDKKSLFPRMYSIDPAHYNYSGYAYKFYVADKGATDNPKDDNPTVFDELHFFFDYQLRQMYIRYLMWNFVGRKSDIQDAGWEFWLGDSNNKGNNRYWFIPFLLGAMGFIWQFTHSRKQAVVTLTLFFFTGFPSIVSTLTIGSVHFSICSAYALPKR